MMTKGRRRVQQDDLKVTPMDNARGKNYYDPTDHLRSYPLLA